MAVKTKTAVAKPKFKSYISDFTLKFGPLQLRGRMVGVRKSEASIKPTWKLVSPEGNPVEQKYIDTVTGKGYSSGECDRAFESAGEVTTVDKDTLDTLKASELPANIMTLTTHTSAEVTNALYSDKGQGYVFYANEEDPDNVELVAAFAAAIEQSPDKAFIGTCNFHGYEGLFRVSVWRGHLVFQKQLYPNEVNDHETLTPNYNNEAKMIKSFFDKKVEPFDPTTYRNASVERQLAALEDPLVTLAALSAKTEAPSESKLASLLASLEDF